MAETVATQGKSIIDPKYRDKYKTPDWLAQVLIDNASATKEVKSKKVIDGEVTDQEITKTVVIGVDIEKLFAIARENGLDVDKYENQRDGHGFAGRFRMTVRNMLQAVIKQRHGLTVDGEWIDAPLDWLKAKDAPEAPTHGHSGDKIVKPVSAKAAKGEADENETVNVAPKSAEVTDEQKAALKANRSKGKKK